MKLGKLLFMGAMSAFVFTGCADNDDKSEWNNGEKPISFAASIQGMNSRAAGTSWADGDEVGIFMNQADGALGSEAANKKYTTSATGKLTPAAGNALYYPAEGDVDFVAYYPFADVAAAGTYKVNVAKQQAPSAIDLLYSANAKGFNKESAQSPVLQFTHQLSQIVFNVSCNDGTVPTTAGLEVNFKGMNTTADFNLATGALSNAGDAAPIAAAVTTSGANAAAIVLPVEVLSDVTVEFALGNSRFETAYTQATLVPGRKYVHNVYLSINNGKPSIQLGEATISDWIEVSGDDINVDFGEGGGDIEEPDEPGEGIVVTADKPFNEMFAAGQGEFTINNVTLPTGSDYVWKHDATRGYMAASGHIGTADFDSESWLISPALALAKGAEKVTLTFDHTFKFGSASQLTLQVKEVGQSN